MDIGIISELKYEPEVRSHIYSDLASLNTVFIKTGTVAVSTENNRVHSEARFVITWWIQSDVAC